MLQFSGEGLHRIKRHNQKMMQGYAPASVRTFSRFTFSGGGSSPPLTNGSGHVRCRWHSGGHTNSVLGSTAAASLAARDAEASIADAVAAWPRRIARSTGLTLRFVMLREQACIELGWLAVLFKATRLAHDMQGTLQESAAAQLSVSRSTERGSPLKQSRANTSGAATMSEMTHSAVLWYAAMRITTRISPRSYSTLSTRLLATSGAASMRGATHAVAPWYAAVCRGRKLCLFFMSRAGRLVQPLPPASRAATSAAWLKRTARCSGVSPKLSCVCNGQLRSWRRPKQWSSS